MKVKWGKSTYGMMRGMVRVANGHYQMKWQGDVVDVTREKVNKFGNWSVRVNGDMKAAMTSFDAAMNWVYNVWGEEKVASYNILNREAGVVWVSRKHKGGCCDPATERYHCM